MWIERELAASDESSLFLIAAWHELFYGYTPDSFQPRLHNVPSLVDELADIARFWLNEPRNQPHAKKVQDELCALLQTEADILKLIPTYSTACNLLCTAKTPQAVVAGAKILGEMKSSYLRAFESRAHEAIGDLPASKGDATQSLRRLATFAFQQGKEDDDVLTEDLDHLDISPIETYEELAKAGQAVTEKYECTLSVVGQIDLIHATVRRQGHVLVANNSLPADYISSFASNRSQVLHVRVTVDSTSIRNAAAAARKRLGLDLGFVSLYTNPDSLRLHHVALVVCNGRDRVFVQSEQAFRRLRPRSRAQLDIQRALDFENEQEVDQRILAAIEQLALASASYDTRTRFVNLWSSLETLAGALEGKTTLDRITSLLVPLIVSRHVHRRTRYIAILCQKHANRAGNYSFGPGFGGQRIQNEEMLKTLCSVRDHVSIKGLLDFASHPLLRYRVYQAWEGMHDPSTLKRSLKRSTQRLDWHLARIYRARNLLVHEGTQHRFIVPLLDNLQNYLSTLVQRLVHEVRNHPTWEVRDVVEFWNARMNHQLGNLGSNAEVLSTADFLEDVDPEPLWAEPTV